MRLPQPPAFRSVIRALAMLVLLVVSGRAFTVVVDAQPPAPPVPVLVLDINTAPGGSDPQGFVTAGPYVYFSAADALHGHELWKYDGLNAPELVADIYPGRGSSQPRSLVAVGGALFFTAEEPTTGRELWKTDGTSAGTVLVRDINVGAASSVPFYAPLTNVNGIVFFQAQPAANVTQIWKSDGSMSGTAMAVNLPSGTTYGDQVASGGSLYFAATIPIYVLPRLFRFNGTSVAEVTDNATPTGSGYRYPTELTAFGGTVYFKAVKSTLGAELWRASGTSAVPVDIQSGAGSSNPTHLTVLGTTLYFSAQRSDVGRELWNVAAVGASPVPLDIVPGSVGLNPAWLKASGSTLYFGRFDAVTGTAFHELWKSDGTAAGTMLVQDSVTNLAALTDVDGRLFFTTHQTSGSNGGGALLWTSDGTPSGTAVVLDAGAPTISRLAAGLGHLYFAASDQAAGLEPWRSDGTALGTTRIADLHQGTNHSDPRSFTRAGAWTFFVASTPETGLELWRTNGTPSGTVMVKDINPGPASSELSKFVAVGNSVFFQAFHPAFGSELWTSDGSDAGTHLVVDIEPGTDSSQPNFLTAVGSTVYFSATQASTGTELWKTDANGTALVHDIAAGPSSSAPENLIGVGGTLFFIASEPILGRELWKSQGTAATTEVVLDIASGSQSSSPARLAVVNGTLYFSAYEPSSGEELWRSDGTAAGTTLVEDFAAGVANSNADPRNVNGVLYVLRGPGNTYRELWRSDGTAAGTTLVHPAVPRDTGFEAVDHGGTIYFTAYDAATGVELWRSDGTNAGTTLVADISPGPPGSAIDSLVTAGGRLYFTDFFNTRLWQSDGTTAGTTSMDLALLSSSNLIPTLYQTAPGEIYLSGNDPVWGREPWVLRAAPPNNPPTADPQSVSTPQDSPIALTLTGTDPETDPLTFAIVAAPTNGTLSGTAPNVTYMPASGFSGADSFTFKVNDGAADSNPATVSITVVETLHVALVNPNGGERVFVGSPYTVRWTGQAASSFDLELSRDGGASYLPIVGCTALPGSLRSCDWTPATPTSTTAFIRVTARDQGTGAVSDASAAPFTIRNGAPSVRLTAPNTAVNWATGTTRTITWTHNLGPASSIRIEVSRDNAATWQAVAASVANASATAGSYDWQVSDPITATALVRVTWTDGAASDSSDVPFTITTPQLTVTAPNTNVNWTIGVVRTIRWSHNLGTADLVRVEVSRDNGTSWTVVATNVANTNATAGVYDWTVAGPTSQQALVRVRREVDAGVNDVSDVPFRIRSAITVTSPNSAVTYGAGSTRTITWNHSYGAAQTFEVHVSTDGGQTWTPLASGVPAATATTGTYTGPMPAVTTSTALVRVSPAGNAGDGDVSNVAFTLAAPAVTVTTPNSNVAWGIGATRTIRWSHNLGAAEAVDIEVSRDGGATWVAIGSGVANTGNVAGTFDWVVTGPATAAGRVRISWSVNVGVTDTSDVDFRIQ